MIWLLAVPLAPLIASLLILSLGQRLPAKGGWLTVGSVAIALLSLLLLSNAQPDFQTVWFETAGYQITIGLRLDGLSRLLALLVTTISLLVSVYAIDDMAAEAERRKRFFCVLSFFIGAMLMLVLANSLILLFVAWEGVGVASYLLIGFWYERKNARSAAFKAFLLTRLGDLGFLLGWLLALQTTGTTDIQTLLTAVNNHAMPAATLTLLALLFFMGAIGKSAQLPLTAWLPAAMAGPSPVSALIHSATMVAAGVYLLLRLFPLFVAAPGALTIVLWVGAVTALFAAVVATQQTDLKRILAWSTVSQLGEMMLALGLGGPLAAAFHLTTQAFFKSTLFMAAGAIDLAAHTRELDELGRLWRKMPLTAFTFLAAALALAGVPPFSAYWSEEQILSQAVIVHPGWGLFLLVLLALSGLYISRASVVTFANWHGAPTPKATDPGTRMIVPMLTGAIAALGLGWLLSGRLDGFLPFPASPDLAWGWRLAAIAASLSGLIVGGLWAFRRGSMPVLGKLPAVLEGGLTHGTNWAGQIALWLAIGLNPLERSFDRLVQVLGDITLWLAIGLNPLERSFDRLVQVLGDITLAVAGDHPGATGLRWSEQLFDRGGQRLSQAAVQLAGATDATEIQGFSANIDRGANWLGAMGQQLRRVQTGKLYLYTTGIFVWLLAVGIVGALLWK